MITVRPLRAEEFETLSQRAKEDGHAAIAPTHVMLKGNDIVGYMSVNGLPCVLWWMDSKATGVVDSSRAIREMENALRFNGATGYLMPCMKDSPYYEHMERAGYQKVCETVVFFKPL